MTTTTISGVGFVKGEAFFKVASKAKREAKKHNTIVAIVGGKDPRFATGEDLDAYCAGEISVYTVGPDGKVYLERH